MGSSTNEPRKVKMKKRARSRPTGGVQLPKEVLEDDRFKDVATDPKFQSIPRKEAKVEIDRRFSKMFTDKRFKMKATIDKRGRPVSTTSTEDLKRFYHLGESEESEDDSTPSKEPGPCTKSTRPDKGNKAGTQSSPGDSDSEDELLDLARGEGNIETSEEDSSDSSDEEEALLRAEKRNEIEWDELDKDAPRADDISRRLAICNMDWHNLKAVDLFVLMSSFAPADGTVKSVSMYPSEFGKERMREEAERGPRLRAESDQALRKYEFDRLKYYYAVVECDSPATANKIYESCDGMEYQTSGAKVDLRFIPDEMDFDEGERTDYCDVSPEDYEPVDFINSALMLSTCESNWDGDDLRRRKALAKAYSTDVKNKRKRANGPNLDDIDRMAEHLKTYIATSDSDDEEPDEDKVDADKYRKLLQREAEERAGEEVDDGDGGDKEITFNPDLNAVVERRREKNDSEKANRKRTPFQEYLERKKEKKRERRQLERARKKQQTTFSDDELPEDVKNDPFFKAGQGSEDSDAAEDQESNEGPGGEEGDEEEEEKRRQQLELLLMDENGDGKRHFSLKKIIKNEKAASKKNKKKSPAKNGELTQEDDFKVDFNDPRFGAIYSDHRFNIDPTDLGYRKTKAMEALVMEKAKRRRSEKVA